MKQLEGLTIGEESGEIALATAEDSREVILALAQQAKEHLYITTRDLSSHLFDRPEIADAFSSLIHNNRNAEIRIVIQNASSAVSDNHRLITLSQRLSSRFHIRNPASMHSQFAHTQIIADHYAYLYRPLESRYEGVANFYAPMEVRKRLEDFNTLWDHALPDPHTRHLHI